MKYICAYLLLIVLAAVALFFFWQQKSSHAASTIQRQKTDVVKNTSQSKTDRIETASTAARPSKPTERLEREHALLNHRPVEFYGKVEDQYGDPVAGADVIGDVIVFTAGRSGKEKHHTKTNADGHFQLSGFSGQSLGIVIQKPGYEQNLRGGNSFIYSLLYKEERRHKPDPHNPVIFKLWKLHGPEPMVQLDMKEYRIPYDGTPTTFDLLTGKKVAKGGDLRLTLTRTPLRIRRGGQKFDWTVTIEAVGGGLVESKDQFMYLAPEQGYVPAIVTDMLATDPKWSPTVGMVFYLKSRQGKVYGSVKLGISSDSERPDTGISIEAYLNPNGSRNLEFDPRKRLTEGDVANLHF